MSMMLSSRWTSAAYLEAARVRTPEIDIDHLYLGLLAVGGQAARLLGRHGVSLASARQRVRESLSDDLATLGVHAPEAVLPPPMRAVEIGGPEWRATPRAHDLVCHAKVKEGTCAVLAALIAEPSGAARRLLAADGVDPDALLAELAAEGPEPGAPERVPLDSGLLPAPARAHRIGYYLSAAPALVADTVADHSTLALWAYDPARAEVTDDGATVRHSRGRKTLTVKIGQTRHREAEREVITWTHEMLDGPHAGQPLRYDRFEVRAAPGGAELMHTAGTRSFGRLGGLIAPLTDWFSTWGMVHGAQRLGLEVADRQAA